MLQNDSFAPNILADEVSTGGVVAGAGLTTTLLLFFENSLEKMIPYFFICAIVIVLDLWFGVQAAKIRGEEVRVSRAIRRTLGKTVEYFAWSVLASSLAVATGYQIIQTGLMLLVIGIECISIFQNWLTIKKGKKVVVDIPQVVESVISDKLGADVRGAIHIEGEDRKTDKNDNEEIDNGD